MAPADDGLAQLEAGLARIVGGKGSQALVQRSRQMCSNGAAPGNGLSQTLMQLASGLLGESLAQRLRQLGADTLAATPNATPHSITGPH
jgi:hypothetical protein